MKLFLGIFFFLNFMLQPLAAEGKGLQLNLTADFDTLENNFVLYRLYNDSVHSRMNDDEWVAMMQRRGACFRQLYHRNNRIIKSIKDAFLADGASLPDAAYDSLFVHVNKAFLSFTLDNFLVDEFAQLLVAHYEERQDTVHIMKLNHIIGSCNTEIARFMDDVAVERAKKYLLANMRLADNYDRLPVEILNIIPLDFMNYCYTLSSLLMVSPSEALEGTDRFARFVDNCKTIASEKQLARWRSFLDRLRSRSARIHQTSVLATKADSLAIKRMYDDSPFRNMTEADLKTADDSVMFYMYKHNVGEMTVEEADRKVYELTLKIFDEAEHHDVSEFMVQEVGNAFTASVSLMDINPKVLTQTRTERVSKLCKRLVHIVQGAHIVKDPFFLESMLGQLACMDKVFKYLPSDEKINYMNELAVKAQVGTIMHVGTVDKLAVLIFDALLKRCPKLFVGLMGMNTVDELRDNRQMLSEWVGMAAAYHDLGKIGISPIFNDDFRALTEREFVLSRKHPELALKYLEADSLFFQFRDVALGHHKWYNGKGGYPESFDNTASPWRTMIDLVTISDCIDAATDNVNRNYRTAKTLDEVLDEFKHDAGRVYNPVMVDAIRKDKQLRRKIEHVVTIERAAQLKEIRDRYIK